MRDTRSALDALADHLNAPDLATVIAATDPDARLIHNLRTHTVEQLRQAAPEDLAARRALRHVANVAAVQAVQNPTADLVARFGPRPSADSPVRSAWDNAITRVVEHDILHNESDPSLHAQRSRSKAAASIQRFETLTSATQPDGPTFDVDGVAHLAARLRSARSTLPLDDHLISTLTSELDEHVERAVSAKPGYLTDLIGDRPEEERAAARWDRAASSIERVRHQNGITPAAGPFEGDSALRRAVGNNDDDRFRVISVQHAIAAMTRTAGRSLDR